MRGNRVIYVSLLITAWIVYFFGNDAGTLAVAVTVTGLPVVLFPFILWSVRRTEVILCKGDSESSSGQEKREVSFFYEIRYGRFLPIGFVQISAHLINRFSGERLTDTAECRMKCGGQVQIFRRLEMDCCGHVDLELDSVFVIDALGLWKCRVPILLEKSRAEILVMPRPFSMESVVEEDVTAMIDSDKYSMYYPGNDPGETFAIREYVPGDSLKTIHWKLSQKTDKLLVREFGRPVIDEILLIVENTMMEHRSITSPERKDALARAVYSLGISLLRSQHTFTLCFHESVSGQLQIQDIGSEEEFAETIAVLLRQSFSCGTRTVAGMFMQGREVCSYAHVTVFSEYEFPDYDLLYNGNHVTLIIAENEKKSGGYVGDGLYKIEFTTEHIQRDLAEVII